MHKYSNWFRSWRQYNPETCNIASTKVKFTVTTKIHYMYNIHVFYSLLDFIEEDIVLPNFIPARQLCIAPP